MPLSAPPSIPATPVPTPTPPVFDQELFKKALSDTWSVFPGEGVGTVMLGVIVFVASLGLLRYRNRHDEAKAKLIEWGQAALITSGVFLLVFMFHYFVLTPKALYIAEQSARITAEAARTKAEADLNKATPTPIVIERVDPENGKKIAELTKRLNAANETIQRQQSTLVAPLDQPIATVQYSVTVSFATLHEKQSTYLGNGMMLVLGKLNPPTTWLRGFTESHMSDGEGHSTFTGNCEFSSSSMGKPIRTLADADAIQLNFLKNFLPAGTAISGAHITLVINNQVTLNFEIPQLEISEEQATGENTVLMVTNIGKGLEPLTTQPSSIPNKEASPH